MSTIVFSQGDATITVPANESIAVASYAEAQAFRIVGFPNFPAQSDSLGVFENNTITVFGPFTTEATVQIQAGATDVLYNVGVAPTIPELINTAGAVIALNVTGTITSAMIVGGVITSTTAAAVTATLETGAVFDAKFDMPVGQSFTWGVVNTGGTNSFTVTAAATGHTVTGSGVVANSTAATFRTIKTAASTFATHRLG